MAGSTPFLIMDNGVKLVSSAILGIDCETIMVGGQPYVIHPPTIARIAGAGLHMANIPDSGSVKEMLDVLPDACKALSWFINGDESLAEELSKGNVREIVEGLEKAISLIGIENFQKLSVLSKSVRTLIANTKS